MTALSPVYILPKNFKKGEKVVLTFKRADPPSEKFYSEHEGRICVFLASQFPDIQVGVPYNCVVVDTMTGSDRAGKRFTDAYWVKPVSKHHAAPQEARLPKATPKKQDTHTLKHASVH